MRYSRAGSTAIDEVEAEMSAANGNKTFRVHVSAMGCAGITVDQSLCRDVTNRHDSPPPPNEVKVVAVLCRNGNVVGVTPLSSALRQAPTKGPVSKTSRHRFLALWTESETPSTISFTVDFPDPMIKTHKNIRLAASSRLMTKDFEIYLGVAWNDQKAVPIAAANLSMKAGKQSKAHDLPLYPVKEVNLDMFQSSKPACQEEKKDDASDQSAQCYGIDTLDALLRVQITVEDFDQSEATKMHDEPIADANDMLTVVVNMSTRNAEPEGSWVAEKHSANRANTQDEDLHDNPTNLASAFAHEEAASDIYSDSHRPDTAEAATYEEMGESVTIDGGSSDDDTADSVTVLSQEPFPALRTHIRKVEEFVESMPLPECKVLDQIVNASFDEEDDEATVNPRDYHSARSVFQSFENAFKDSQCGALSHVRTWLQSRDGDEEGNRDDFMSILSQTTRGTATTTEGRGFMSTRPVARMDRLKTAYSLGIADMNVVMNSSTEEADESTIDGTLNSFPLDERSFRKDDPVLSGSLSVVPTVDETSVDSMNASVDSASVVGRRRDPPCRSLNLFQCGGGSKPDKWSRAGLAGSSSGRNRMVCTDLQVPDDVLRKFVPQTDQTSLAVSTSIDGSPHHVANVANFSGGIDEKIKSLFRFRKTHQAKSTEPPLQHLRTFPDPDGDYLSVGDLTLTTLERRVDRDNDRRQLGSDFGLLKNRSKTSLPAPSATISSFYAFSKTTATDQSGAGEFPFDEADPFKPDDSSNALAPDMSAAVGLAWAKQRAERTNRRQPGKRFCE